MNGQKWKALASAMGIMILILDTRTGISAAREGIELCIKVLIPSLFPFFVLSAILTGNLGGMQPKWMKKIEKWFHFPEGSGHLLIVGVLSGYPVGAGNVCGCYRKKQLSKEDAERMIALCNNAGPSFLFGVLSGQFSHIGFIWMLWGTQILSLFLTARLTNSPLDRFSAEHSGAAVSPTQAMNQALRSMASVCGWVIIARVLLSFLNQYLFPWLPGLIQIIMTGLVELTNGCLLLNKIPQEGLRFTIASILLAFGGICVHMQTGSVCRELSRKKYLRIKGIQSLVCGFLSIGIQFLFRPSNRIIHPGFLLIIAAPLIVMTKRRKKAVAFRRHLMYNQEKRTERG